MAAAALRFTIVTQPTFPPGTDYDSIHVGEEKSRAIVVLDANKSFRVIFLASSAPLPPREDISRALLQLVQQRPGWRRRGWGIVLPPAGPLPYPRAVSFLEAFRVDGQLRIHLFGHYAARLTNLNGMDVLAVAYQQRTLLENALPHAVAKSDRGGTYWRWNNAAALDLSPAVENDTIPRRRYLNLEKLPVELRALTEAVTPAPLPSYSTLYAAGLWPLVKRRMHANKVKLIVDALDPERQLPTNGYDPDEGADGLPESPVVKAETQIHIAAHFLLALLGLYRFEGDSSARDALHPDRLAVMSPAELLEAYEVAAEFVDEWRPTADMPAL